MDYLKRQARVYRTFFVTGWAILLLFATATLLFAALQNWGFTTATNYTFDSIKVEVSAGLAKLRLVTVIHDEEAEFTGIQSNTQWETDHIELDATGLSTGSGTYTSQIIDSGMAGAVWGKISWTEALTQDSASFSPTKSVGSLSTGFSVYSVDIDGDDDIDVIAVQKNRPRSSYFENNGAETFTSRVVNKGTPQNARDLHGGDINKDGRQDFVAVAKDDLVWFENKGGTPAKWKKRVIVPTPSSGIEVEVADVNGDGNLDVVIGDDGSVQWYQNNGANPPSWTAHVVDDTLSVVDALSTGDLDADGDLDLLAGDEAGLYWYENSGANPPLFIKRNIDTTVVNAESIITADLNNDGNMDVVGFGLNSLNLNWYENNGSTPPGFTKRTIDSGPLTSPVSVAAGDLDRDGNEDVVLVDGADVHWYHNEGGAPPTWTKTTLTAGTVSNGDHLFLVNLEDDVNGDADLDILVAEGSQVSWWENLMPHSNVRFQLRTSTAGTSWSSWQGPGGRSTSSYTDPTGETITVPNGRYIQYRAFLRTHNSTSLNPQLSMVRLDPANASYPTDNPTVQNVTGQDYFSISSFTETLGSGNQGLVKYQISNDGTIWYYHNGSSWVPAAQGFDQANTAAEVNSDIPTFDDDVGAGTFYFKAFLNSDGNQQVELDQIEIDYSTVGPPVQLVFSVEPSNAEVNAAISPAIKVQVQDANGQLINAVTPITLGIGTIPGGSSLAGTLTVAAVGGEATFSGISIDKVGSSYTLVASVSGLSSATSAAFDITAGAATQLVISVQPSNAISAEAITPAIKVQVHDANGNLVTTATNSIALAMGTNPGGTTLAGTLTVAAVAGVATFSDISIDKAGSNYTLVASASGLSSATSASFDITAGAATQLVFSVGPTNTISTAAIYPSIRVQVQDANGNLVTTATDSITLAMGTNSGGSSLGGILTVAVAGGEATFNDISLDKAGSGYILVASASGLNSATSAGFDITAGLATQLVFSVEPSKAISTEAISPAIKVEVRDDNGNLVTTATDSITLAMGTNSGGAFLTGTLAVGAVGGEATFSNISIDKAGSNYTLVASASGLSSATSAGFDITAGEATQLVFSVQPSSADARAAISPAIEVQVQDANGNLVTTATDSITLVMGTNSGGATLGGILTVAAAGGEASFSNVSIDEAGSDYILVASASGLSSATSVAFYIMAGAANQLVFSFEPSNAISTEAISPAIKLEVHDANGNLVTTATDSITLAIGNNPGGSTLAGTLAVAAEGGEATFGNISIDKSGSGYILVASASGLSSATSAAFDVTGGEATQLVFSVGPTNTISTVAISPVIKVQVQDANGNMVTTATISITLAMGSNPGGSSLDGTLTVAAVGGEATFNDTSIEKAGSGYTLVASASGLSPATSADFDITAGDANQMVFSVEPSSAISTEAISPAIKVQVQDVNGNMVTTATNSITLAMGTNPGGSTLAGTLTVAAVGGEATINDISIDKAGSGYTLVASASGLSSATSVDFDIRAGDANQLIFIAQPTNAEAKVAISPVIKIQVQDANGNLVTTATNSITLAMGTNSGGASLGGILTVAAVGGEATFSNISIDKAGSSYTLVASASGLSSATSAGFDITAGTANRLVFSVEPSSAISTEAISPAIKVEVQDANGNLITTATDSITIAVGTNPGRATIAGTLTVAAVGGEATFSSISIDQAGSSYTLVASASGLSSASSVGFDITAGAANQLAFSVEPSNTESKAVISPAIKVQVQDTGGNQITTATDSITLAIGTNSGGSSLAGTLTVGAVAGEATFNDISIEKAGSNYTLVASASGLSSATSVDFGITAGEANQLAFSVEPSNAQGKAAISPVIKVQVQDANGQLINVVTPITLAIGTNPGGSSLAGILTVGAVGGEATFNDISIEKVGSNYTLVASASGLSSATSAPFHITAGEATRLAFSVEPSNAEAKAAISPAIKVQVQDSGGNLIITATDSITLAGGTNSGGATLGGTLTVAAVGGEATFSNISIDKAVNSYTLVASAPGLSSATSGGFSVTAGQELASGGSRGIAFSGGTGALEAVIDTGKRDTRGNQTTESSKQGTGVTTPRNVGTNQTGITAFLEGASTAIPQKQAVVRDDSRTGLLNRDKAAKTGTTTTIRYRAASGLVPEIDVYDANKVRQVAAAPMTEIGTTGIYEYALTLDTNWGVGNFTIVASESNKGTLKMMTLAVAATAGVDAAQILTDTGITVPTLLTDIETKLDTVDTNLINARAAAKASPNTVRKATTASPQNLELGPVYARIREISDLLKQVSSENGVKLDVMYEPIEETTTDVSELQDKVERLKVLLNLNREIAVKILEQAPLKEPVIKTWLESGSVILKILVVNPSKTETQLVPLKVYLPKEVSPKDIMYFDDLKLVHDPEKGMYFVGGEVELGPGQSMTKMVEMEDIWIFKEEQLSSFVNQAKGMASQLEESSHAEEAAALVLRIEQKVQDIKQKQKQPEANPGEHIRAYRERIPIIAAIEQDLAGLERLQQEAAQGEEEDLPTADKNKIEGHREMSSRQEGDYPGGQE